MLSVRHQKQEHGSRNRCDVVKTNYIRASSPMFLPHPLLRILLFPSSVRMASLGGGHKGRKRGGGRKGGFLFEKYMFQLSNNIPDIRLIEIRPPCDSFPVYKPLSAYCHITTIPEHSFLLLPRATFQSPSSSITFPGDKRQPLLKSVEEISSVDPSLRYHPYNAVDSVSPTRKFRYPILGKGKGSFSRETYIGYHISGLGDQEIWHSRLNLEWAAFITASSRYWKNITYASLYWKWVYGYGYEPEKNDTDHCAGETVGLQG
ncbi:hypothetical protein CEXT_15261 [Caerostris extrusa]|uniref:Uncharacterized protein n=1 Tax=Caerostris extrusa TaxID=172846 RepID=A0AAV4NW79_CAEEX|nr:hypothetical protein CEXT_15261 [Caerostris extrusa]